MNCFQCERNLSAYLDDELPMDERLEIETHLDTCEACRTEFASHQTAWEAAHRVAAEAAPDGLWNGIAEQLDGPASGGVEELTLMVKGLAAEIGELKRSLDEMRLMMQQSQWAEGSAPVEAYGRTEAGPDIRVRTVAPPVPVMHPRDARQPASIEQLRRSS